MRFESVSNGGNCNSCGWIIAEGEITAETPEAYRRFVAEHGSGGDLMLDSPGGNLGAALELGRLIRENGASTSVGRTLQLPEDAPWARLVEGGICESACAFAFLAGVTRAALEDTGRMEPRSGRLGMHRFYTADGSEIPTAATQQLMGQILLYVLEMEVDPRILSISSQTAQDSMYYFSREELLDLDIVTERRSAPMRLAVVNDALAAVWTEFFENGSRDRRIWLSCRNDQWFLRIRDFTGTGYAFDPDDPKDLSVAVGDTRYPLNTGAITSMREVGGASDLEVRLPFDVQDHPQEFISFRTNELRNFWMAHSFDDTLPRAGVLDVLYRACGD